MKKKSKPKKSKMIIIIITIIIIILVFLKINRVKTKNYISLIVDNEDITSKLQDEIFINNDSVIYISINDTKSNIDKDIYIEDDKIITCSEKKVAAIELNKEEIEINGAIKNVDKKPFKTDQGTIYLPISELQNIYDMELLYNEDYKNIVIDYYSKRMEKAYTTKKVFLKENQKTMSSTLEKIEKGNWVVYINEENGWAKVRTQNGNIGFIKKSKLTNFVVEREDLVYINKPSTEDVLETNIKKEDIKSYKNRLKTVENIIEKAVSKQKRTVKINYIENDDSIELKRFKIEAKAILKECGISFVE